MNSELPTSWTNNVLRAAGTLLLVAVVAFVVWQLLQHFVGALIVIVVLLGIFRWLLRGRM